MSGFFFDDSDIIKISKPKHRPLPIKLAIVTDKPITERTKVLTKKEVKELIKEESLSYQDKLKHDLSLMNESNSTEFDRVMISYKIYRILFPRK